MFSQLVAQFWFLAIFGLVALRPARYVYRHILHSPRRRDITLPPEDLSWRTSSLFYRNLALLIVLGVFAALLLKPAAGRFSNMSEYIPLLFGALGIWMHLTVPSASAEREKRRLEFGAAPVDGEPEKPARFWTSGVWKAVLGLALAGVATSAFKDALLDPDQERCLSQETNQNWQGQIDSCSTLISAAEGGRGSATLYRSRGYAYHRLGDFQHALADYSKAIAINPSDGWSLLNRGLVFKQMGDSRRALADFSESIRVAPEDSSAFLQRGLIFLDQRSFGAAEADFTKALELDPKNAWAVADRGLAHAWNSDTAQAEADFKAAEALDPHNQIVLHGRAVMNMSANNLAEAVHYLTLALEQDPDDVWALYTRGNVYWTMGETEKARDDDDRLASKQNPAQFPSGGARPR